MQDLDKYRAMLNIVRSDHTVTVFLQTLNNQATSRPDSVLSLNYRPDSVASFRFRPASVVLPSSDVVGCMDTAAEYTNGIYIGPKKPSSSCKVVEAVEPSSSAVVDMDSSSSTPLESSTVDFRKQLIGSESDSDSEQLGRKKNLLSRFLCMPLKSRKRGKKRVKRKSHV